MRIVEGGIVEQFRQAFGNVLTTLREAGGVPEDLVSITIYLTDIPDYQAHGSEIGAVWRELAGPVYPAMAGIGTHRPLAARGPHRDPRRRRHPRRTTGRARLADGVGEGPPPVGTRAPEVADLGSPTGVDLSRDAMSGKHGSPPERLGTGAGAGDRPWRVVTRPARGAVSRTERPPAASSYACAAAGSTRSVRTTAMSPARCAGEGLSIDPQGVEPGSGFGRSRDDRQGTVEAPPVVAIGGVGRGVEEPGEGEGPHDRSAVVSPPTAAGVSSDPHRGTGNR